MQDGAKALVLSAAGTKRGPAQDVTTWANETPRRSSPALASGPYHPRRGAHWMKPYKMQAFEMHTHEMRTPLHAVMLCRPRDGMFLGPAFSFCTIVRAGVIITHTPRTSDAHARRMHDP